MLERSGAMRDGSIERLGGSPGMLERSGAMRDGSIERLGGSLGMLEGSLRCYKAHIGC